MFGKLKEIFGQKELQPIVVTNGDEHNVIYKRACDLTKGRMFLENHFPKLSSSDTAKVQEAIRCFQAVLAFHPQNWNAFWMMGKCQQVLKNDLAAYASFKKAYEIKQDNINVPRELAEVCLKLGYGAEAVTACHSAIELAPDNAGLHANLALAYLIAGEVNFAKRAVQFALELDGNDTITKRIEVVIDEVMAGKRAQPENLRDLQPGS